MDVRPIDLRATHPGIVEQDFLQMDPEAEEEAWDAISLSLVLNFVPEPRDRGASGRVECLGTLQDINVCFFMFRSDVVSCA